MPEKSVLQNESAPEEWVAPVGTQSEAKSGHGPLATGTFRMGHGAFLRLLARRHTRRYVVGAAVVIVALLGISIGFSDFRYAVLALMILFIVIPMLAALLYINYALAPLRSFNTMAHRLELTEQGVKVEILGPVKSEDREEGIEDREEGIEDREEGIEDREEGIEDRKKGIEDREKEDKEELEQVGVLEIAYRELGAYQVGVDYVIIPVSGDKGFIYLPASAFAGAREMREFLKAIFACEN